MNQKKHIERLLKLRPSGFDPQVQVHYKKEGELKPGKWEKYEGQQHIDERAIWPNEIVFDLDDLETEEAREENKKIIEILDEIEVPYFVADSGGKRFHIHIFFKLNGLSKQEYRYARIALFNIIKEKLDEAEVNTDCLDEGVILCENNNHLIRCVGGRNSNTGRLKTYTGKEVEKNRIEFSEEVEYPNEIETLKISKTGYVDTPFNLEDIKDKLKELKETEKKNKEEKHESTYEPEDDGLNALRKIPPVKVLRTFNKEVKKGQMIKCPGHNDTDASLQLTENDEAICWGSCGTPGRREYKNAIDLVIDIKDCDFYEAKQYLMNKFDIEVKEKGDKKEIIEKALSDEKWSWNHNTEFLTFVKNLKHEDKKINYGETYELPKKLAEKAKERKLAFKNIWFCTKCESIIRKEFKPAGCPKCDAKKSSIKALHPYKETEIGETLKNNYNFLTIRETIGKSSPGTINIYTGGIYQENGVKGLIRHKTKQIRPNTKQSEQGHVMDHIAVTTDISIDNLGIKEHKVVLNNCTLDLKTLKAEPHSPELKAVRELEADYERYAICPKFMAYLKEDLPNEKDRRRLQELLGCALVNEKLHKKGGIVVGPTDSGKSSLIKIIKQVFGKDNTASQDPHSLAHTRWGKAKLRTVLLNTTDEVESKKIKNLAVLKKIMDGNSINAEKKGQPTFEFEPKCEHLFAANQTPTADRNDNAFWNRWVVMEMPYSITEEEQDPDLPDKILEEKSGILNWIITGYKRFMQDKSFTYPQDWETARNRWVNWGNSIQRFIENCLVREGGNKISSKEMYKNYTDFAEKNGLDIKTQKKVTQDLKAVSYITHSNNFRFDGVQNSGFKNVAIRNDVLLNGGTDGRKKEVSHIISLSDMLPYYILRSIVIKNKVPSVTPFKKGSLKRGKTPFFLDYEDDYLLKRNNIKTKQEARQDEVLKWIGNNGNEIEKSEYFDRFGDTDKAQEILDDMMEDGVLYEPKPGKIRKV